MNGQILKLGIPAGSLQEATGELFRKAGYKITYASRSYYPAIDDPEIHCTLIRAQEMPRYVQDGSLDCGLTGYDWILENDARVIELAELVFSKVSKRPVRWVLAVPNDSPVQSVKDLQENAAQNVKEMKPLFGDLSRQLENLRNNQTTVTLKMNENIKAVADNFDTVSSKMNESLRRVSDSFNATAKDAFGEIKGVLSVYQKATDDMIAKLDETKNSSLSLLNVSEEIKTGIQRANNALTVFFTSQDVKDKRRDRYTLIMTIIIGIICGVLIFSLFR